MYRSHSHRKTIGRHSAARDDARNEQTRDGVDVAGILDEYLATRGERTAERCRPVRGRGPRRLTPSPAGKVVR